MSSISKVGIRSNRVALAALFLFSALAIMPAGSAASLRAGEPVKTEKADLADITANGKLKVVKLGDSTCFEVDGRSYFTIMESQYDNRTFGPKLKESEIKTWTKLSDLPAQLREHILAWDKSTSEADIDAICDPSSDLYKSLPKDSQRWVRKEYLLTVKAWIKAGKMPFTFKLATRAESTDRMTGGVTLGSVAHLAYDKDGNRVNPPGLVVPEGGSTEFHMTLVKENFEAFGRKQVDSMANGGGMGVMVGNSGYGLESTSYATFWHELTHILDSVHRVQYNQEASPEANKLFFLSTISKADYEAHFKKRK